MIKKALAGLSALSISSAACAQVGFAGSAWMVPQYDPAAIFLPASVGTTKSTKQRHLFDRGLGGVSAAGTTLTLLHSEFTAWLSMQGFLTAKESK